MRTNPRWLKVCDIKAPKSGLETKFSYAWLAGMTLRGDETGDRAIYSDTAAQDTELAAFAQKVTVSADSTLSDLQFAGTLRLQDGQSIALAHDLALPVPASTLATRLAQKAEALLGPAGRALWSREAELETRPARDIGAWMRGCGED